MFGKLGLLFFSKTHDVVLGLAFDGNVDPAPIVSFAESVNKAKDCNYQSSRLPFADFFGVYPAYIAAMSTCNDYYLSDIELLALAQCTGKNVATFVHSLGQHNLKYTRSHVANPELLLL